MKNIKSFLGLFLAVAAMGFTACDDDDYSATPMPKTDQVYFSSNASSTFFLEENQNQVDVVLNRINTKKELTVTVSAQDTSSLFNVAKTAVFAADSATTHVAISFDFAKLVPDNDYALSLSVSDGCEYADSAMSIIIKFAPWTSWAPFGWEYPKGVADFAGWEAVYASFLAGGATSFGMIAKNGQLPVFTYNGYYSGAGSQPLFIRQSQLNPTQAQLMLYDWGSGINYTIDWDKDANKLTPASPVFFATNATYGAVNIADATYYWDVVRKQEIDYDVTNSYDEENGKFTFYIAYYVSAGLFGDGPETLQLPGFEKPDYSVTVKDLGGFFAGEQLAEALDVKFGKDVAYIKYTTVPDDFETVEQLDSVAALVMSGAIPSIETKEQGSKVIYGEFGSYMFIACLYDNDGNYVGYDYASFMIRTFDAIGTGAYEYSTLFAIDDTTSFVQDSMMLFRCTQDPTLYKIGNWGELGSFYFTMDENGTVKTEEQLVSTQDGGYYVADVASGCALYNYKYSWATVLNQAYGVSATYLTASMFDSDDMAFYFNNVYFTADAPSTFGYEAFYLDVEEDEEENVQEAAAARNLKAPFLGAMNKTPKFNLNKVAKAYLPTPNLVVK